MRRDPDRYKVFTRRALVLGGGQLALLSVLAGRMYYLQVVDSARYRMQAEENRINLRLLPPPRGRIVDRAGLPLAVNQRNYKVVIVSEQTDDVKETLDKLDAIVPLSDSDRARILREVERKRGFVPINVRENLSWEEVARIEVNAPDIPGVMIDVGQSRHYPFGEAAAHVLGYVAAVTERELSGDPLLELPDFRTGKSGIEKVQDLRLRGKAGSSEVEVNAIGRVIRELSRNAGQFGDKVTLTIDMGLQEFVHERLTRERSASAVVMDVHTGEVLAMTSTPSFDPNAFTKGISTEEWRALTADARAPLTNKAISGQYAPGSTFKMMVALAALEAGIASPAHEVFCPGYVELGDVSFHCWKKQGHGRMDMYEGIRQSCDVYFYDLARRTGVDRIAAMARRFGLGRELDIDLSGEQPGLMPTRDWKLATLDVPWQLGETLVTGIGQGFVLATPLQLAVMTAWLVNGGRAVRPFLVRAVGPAPPAESLAASEPFTFPQIGIRKTSLAFIRRAMAAVTNTPRGTAFKARIERREMAMGGKTGTSQVRRITEGEREAGMHKAKERPWGERDHALFVGYAPVDDPRYAVAVVVEHGGSGTKAAAPVARDILVEAQRRDPSRKSPPPKYARTDAGSAAPGR